MPVRSWTRRSSRACLPIQQEGQPYDGETGFAHNYNPQIGGPLKGTLGVAFNSKTFPLAQPPNAGADDTPPDPCAATTLADGKQHYIFDVKATEQNVPLIFGGAFVGLNGPTLHATARTELDQIESGRWKRRERALQLLIDVAAIRTNLV